MQKHAFFFFFLLKSNGWSQSYTVPIATIGMLHLLKILKSRHVHILMKNKNESLNIAGVKYEVKCRTPLTTFRVRVLLDHLM
jgi:hypothetical protein